MTSAPNLHIPVMCADMITALEPHANAVYVDGTFGAGGYTQAILRQAPTAHVVGFDRDPEARARYDALPADVKSKITFIDAPFSRMYAELNARDIRDVDGVVLDLGVSSPQLDDAARGFSFRFDGPLDMRMDPRVGVSAADIVNTMPEKDLADLIYKYGEERLSRVVARAIIAARVEARIDTTEQLAAIIRRVIKTSPKDKIDPCTRTFQALRIAVNGELDELQDVLRASLAALKPEGRLVVVTFHSLEDRIVKQFFTDYSDYAPRGSRHVPGNIAAEPLLYLPTRKALAASETESAQNPRSRSAKLRIAVRTATKLPDHFLKAA